MERQGESAQPRTHSGGSLPSLPSDQQATCAASHGFGFAVRDHGNGWEKEVIVVAHGIGLLISPAAGCRCYTDGGERLLCEQGCRVLAGWGVRGGVPAREPVSEHARVRVHCPPLFTQQPESGRERMDGRSRPQAAEGRKELLLVSECM